jgi:hypothetical protein
MPTYTVLLAHDITYYGNVSVEGDTWQEAVASLTSFDWDECYEQGDGAWEQRVVHVEAEDGGGIVAEDIAYNCAMVHYMPIIHRLTALMTNPDRVPCMVTHQALADYIYELRTMVQDPIFKKETQA